MSRFKIPLESKKVSGSTDSATCPILESLRTYIALELEDSRIGEVKEIKSTQNIGPMEIRISNSPPKQQIAGLQTGPWISSS